MDFHQLYYTSCRTGLSGYAGYQFNAVTPGVEPEVMDAVEALGSYEPPATLGHSPTPEEIAGCPVNLCFVPGPRPIVANVAFTGTDYSGRFGNYFAHALVPAGGAAWDGPLPIELWRAGLWTRDEVPGTDLPAARGPLPTGPLHRAAVDAFLDRAAGRSRLPALLAAAERAVLDEDRSVVILAADADEAARWIAALSFLLQPPVVARMSFATYQFRPSYSRHHVVGTVPGAEITADERTLESFYLFDFTGGAASEVDAGPLAELLAATGATAAEALWRRASALAAGGELRLADWYPPVVAAALLDGGPNGGGVGVGPAELDAVCAWLPEHAARLGGDVVARIGAAALAHDAASPAHLAGLADAAADRGLDELLAIAEERMVAALFAPGTSWGGRPDALRSPRARDFAVRRYGERLAGAAPADVVGLLDKADGHGVRPEPRVLHACGFDAIGPGLLRTPEYTDYHDVVRRWPDVRAGVLRYLGQAPPGDPNVAALFDAGFAGAVPETELKGWPALREAALLSRARREPERRVDTALAVLSGRGPSGRIDEALLHTLWPDGWSLDDAAALLSRLPDGAAGDPVFVPWVERLLFRPLVPDELDPYGAFCDLIGRLPLAGMLRMELQDRLKAMAWIRKAERRFAGAGAKKERLATGESLLTAYDGPSVAPAKDYLRARLAVLLPTLPHDLRAALLVRAPAQIQDEHMAGVGRDLDGDRTAAIPVAAAAFATLYGARRVKGGKPVAEVFDGVLQQHLPGWRRRELNAVERELRREIGPPAEEFKRWRLRHCKPRRSWLPTIPRRS